MTRLRVTGPARRDINQALRRSADEFGRDARSRYQRLFRQALDDLQDDPDRPGVREVEDVRAGYRVYHLKFSARNASGGPVRSPRHVVVFYLDPNGDLVVARIFHDRQLLERHLGDDG